jgi:hypothetical protein
MGHDQDSNQGLDEEEFAHVIANYAEFLGNLHNLIDFMCVVSSQPETTEYQILCYATLRYATLCYATLYYAVESRCQTQFSNRSLSSSRIYDSATD